MEQQIIAELIARGVSPPVAQGIVANMKAESNLQPGINEISPVVAGSRGGFGLNQWTGPRRVAYEQFAAERGAPLDDLQTQLDFTMYELQGPERAAYSALQGVQDPIEAARIYSEKFLRPGIPNMDKRLGYAADIASRFDPNDPAIIGADARRAIGKGLLANTTQSTEQGGTMEPETQPQQRQGLLGGLLGGFLGPEGRDARARLAIGIEGLMLNPNQALVGQLEKDIQGRETERQKNKTVEWLLSQGRTDLADAIEGGLPAADALRIATEPVAGALEDPAAFRALDLQARAAGFKPRAEGGDGSYEDFMATRGSGLAAEARAIGAARGEATAAAPGELALYNTLEFQVNDLLNDPYLPNMLGPVASRTPNITADAARVQSKMDQISGGAFLQARQLLKGGGAITDFESQKAEQAFIRMNAAQKPEDYRKAMMDFLDAVRAGLPKLEGQGAPAVGGGTQAPASNLGLSPEDLQYLEGN
jgi:hypothetical protein